MHSALDLEGNGLILFGTLMVSILILVNARQIGDALQIMDHPDAVRKGIPR